MADPTKGTCPHKPGRAKRGCPECNRERVAEWYRNNKETRARYMRDYRRRKAEERWADS